MYTLQESYALSLWINNYAEALTCAFNLGHAYMGNFVPTLHDPEQAEQWYRRSLELTPESDHLGRGQTQGQFGFVVRERFKEVRQAGLPGEVLLEHWSAALKAYQEALAMLPPDEVDTRAVTYNQLGNIYYEAGEIEQTVAHWRESIRYKERAGNLYGAALTRENVAIAYANAGRFDDVLLFARAALRGFEQFGPAAASEAARAQQIIAQIEGLARGEDRG